MQLNVVFSFLPGHSDPLPALSIFAFDVRTTLPAHHSFLVINILENIM
jgi:hypothetical protein